MKENRPRVQFANQRFSSLLKNSCGRIEPRITRIFTDKPSQRCSSVPIRVIRGSIQQAVRGRFPVATRRWHGIEAAPAPRVTAAQTLEAQPAAAKRAVGLDRLDHVMGTGRLETAAAPRPQNQGEHRRDQELIGADEEANHGCAKIAARVPRAIYSARSASAPARPAAARMTRTIQRPGRIRGWESRTISRSRRRRRLRTTAFPTRREAMNPKRVLGFSRQTPRTM